MLLRSFRWFEKSSQCNNIFRRQVQESVIFCFNNIMIYELNEEKSNQIVHCWFSGTFIIKFVTATYKELKKGMTFQHFPIQIYDENQWKTTDFGKEASNLDVNILSDGTHTWCCNEPEVLHPLNHCSSPLPAEIIITVDLYSIGTQWLR